MKRLTKRDIQRNELNILIAEKEICNFSNLKFYLSGGTYLSEVVKNIISELLLKTTVISKKM